MENRGRIVHHPKGIDCCPKLIIFETLSDIIGKTRPHEENFLARFYLKTRLGDINNCPKLHILNFC
jgi:hypothetical protein